MSTATTDPTWTTSAGTVRGALVDGTWRATGIRYARAERFAVPEPVPLRGDIDATGLGPACPQVAFPLFDEVTGSVKDILGFDEDCLTLSITTPAGTAADARLPVMVWIHGGSYVTGAGDLPIYQPTRLVTEQNVLVVNVTYRLGLFGYLAREGVPGNLGLLDQRTALGWVQQHIADFGGDPDNVTVFGESAGGDSVAHLMIADGSTDLMRRAIVMSAPLGLMSGRDRMSQAMSLAAADLNAESSVEQVLERTRSLQRMPLRHGLRAGMPFGPQYGMDPLPAEAEREAALEAVAANIDLLAGYTHREFALFVPGQIGRLRLRPRMRETLVNRFTSRIYAAPAQRFARLHAAAGGNTGAFLVTHGSGTDDPLAGAHTTDLPLVFSGPHWDRIAEVSGGAWRVEESDAREMRSVLAEFARSGTVPTLRSPGISVRPV